MQGFYETHRDNMRQAHAWYKENDRFLPHFHSSVELVYVLSGALRATVDGETHIVPENTLLIDSSYAVHSYETPEASSLIIAIIPLSEVPSIAKQLRKQSFARVTLPDDPLCTLRSLMEMMVRFQDATVTMNGLCHALLGQLIDRAGLIPVREGSQALFIRDVLEYIQAHHAEPLTGEALAARFGYSRSYFSHLFSAHLRCTLADSITALRCGHAAQLLRETDMRVADVAMAVGFESLRTFYRAFKKQYHVTPTQYAKG